MSVFAGEFGIASETFLTLSAVSRFELDAFSVLARKITALLNSLFCQGKDTETSS
jgi:hypothetical protein